MKQRRGNIFIGLTKVFLSAVTSVNSKNNSPKIQKNFLKEAKGDLDAFKILYDNRKYPRSIYHLQQAAEKVSKATCLFLGIISDSDVKNISHHSPMAFINMLKENWMEDLVEICYQITGKKLLAKNKDYDYFRNVVKKGTEEIAKMDKEQIMTLLNLLNNVNYSSIMKKMKVPKKLFSVDIKWALDFGNVYLISIVTYPHAFYTRYPNGKITPDYYKKGVGIVDTAEEIANKLEKYRKSLYKRIRSSKNRKTQ